MNKLNFLMSIVITGLSFFMLTCSKPPKPSDGKPNLNNESVFKSRFESLQVMPTYIRPKSSSIAHPEPENAKNEILNLAGAVFELTEDSSNDPVPTLRPTPYSILKDNYEPKLETFNKEIIFEEIIDNSIKTNFSLLSFVSNNLDANSKAAVTYETIQHVFVDRNKGFDWNKWQRAKQETQSDNVKDLFAVLSVTLNRLSSKKFQKLEAGAKIAGVAFSTGGQIYHNATTTQNFFEVILSGYTSGFEKKLESQETKEQLTKISGELSISIDSVTNLLLYTTKFELGNYEKLNKNQKEMIKLKEALTRIPDTLIFFKEIK